MEMHRQDEACVNCGANATHAIRLNSPQSMSVWSLPLVPTGARLDAWLCLRCLKGLHKNAYADLYFGLGTDAPVTKEATHNSTVQKQLARQRKEKRHASL